MISITDNLTAAKGVYFELIESVSIPGLKINGDNIELVFDGTDKEKLIGFRILVTGPDLQDNILAYQKAYRLTNLLTLKTGWFVFHKRPREFASNKIGQDLKSLGHTSINNTLVNLDISDNAILSLLDKDSLTNQQLAHFSNGIKAFEGANFGEAVREFYQVIEGKTPSHLEKYKFLRHGLSHDQLDNMNTINRIQIDFGIICVDNPFSTSIPKAKYIDTSDPKIQVILEKEANYLLMETFKQIDPKVRVKRN